MELSILLAKVIGVAALVKAAAIILRRDELQEVAEDFLKARTLLMFIAGFELILGLLLVNVHNIWTTSWPVIITILGWAMVIEGAFVYLTPAKKVKKIFEMMMSKKCMTFWTILLIVIGLCLVKAGFGY